MEGIPWKLWPALHWFNAFLEVFLLMATVYPRGMTALNLDGAHGSYAQYPAPDMTCANASISLQFKTQEKKCLLFYLHRKDKVYLELTLKNGRPKLRADFGLGSVEITTAHLPIDTSDGQWHTINISRNNEVTTFNVDDFKLSSSSSSLSSPSSSLISSPNSSSPYVDKQSSPVEAEAFIFMGGFPSDYETIQQMDFHLPFVDLETHFRGSIRNFFYQECTGPPYRPEILSSSGILTKDVDLCVKVNPCLNGGRCLTTDAGRICNCVSTEYTGDRCEIQKIPSDATFLGAQYISYNVQEKKNVMMHTKDVIHIDFRTKQANSLLFYTGNFNDYIIVLLEDGGIVIKLNVGNGKLQRDIRPHNVRFDDNKWHQVHIKREAQDLNVEVDGMYRAFGSTTGQYVRLSSSVLYVAGSPNPKELAESDKIANFKGCMRKVKYTPGGEGEEDIDIFEEAQKEDPRVLQVVGEVLFNKCKDLVDSHPVTFATPESYLTVATWDKSTQKASIAFQFRTVEQAGLMIYCNGNRDSQDFFALEIMDGKLYLAFDMGNGGQKIKVTDSSISDGNPHDVFFEYNQHMGSISVDGHKTQFSSGSSSHSFDLHGELYVGGIGPAVNISTVPKEVWSAMFGLFYVGCLQDMVINGNMVDLAGNAKQQNRSNVVAYCNKMESQCQSHPCTHQGKCVQGWNRFTCDCRATGYTGTVCQNAAVTLRFDGTQYLQVTFSEHFSTQAEDISLRFRTMHGSGLLFHAVGTRGDSMELFLEKGVLYLSVIVGSGAKTLSAGHTLGDDRWHTVIIHRRLNIVEVTIDSERPVTDHIPGITFTMNTSKIVVGQTSSSLRDGNVPYRRLSKRSSEPSSLMLGDDHRASPGRYSGFIGSMQSFMFNGKDFFHMASLGHSNIEKTAQIDPDEHVVREPVTFKSVDAYAVLPRLLAHDKFSISLQFKTTEKDGLILYNGGSGNDFFALELSNGFLYYVYNMGEGEQRVRANVIRPLNDNKWHEIGLIRVEITKQLLRVDDNTPTIDDLSEAKNNRFDLDGKMYLGGVEKTMYPSLPKMIASRHGFVGCLASLDLNGYLPNVMREAKPITESVGDGCKGPITKCVNDSCANFGRCVQQWNTYTCDCDMTSYTGPMCTDESVSYKFGRHPGLITFTNPKGQRPSTRSDSVAFGFQTTQENATLLRIDSENYGDFIQVELLNGKVLILYNMGTFNHPIGCHSINVSDGTYHVIRFTRTGANASLQVDAQRPVTKNPTGHQSHTFNNQAFIKIGGNKAHNQTIIDHFEGVVSGLVLNGVRIFELAKERDSRIEKEGSVLLHRRKPRIIKSDLFPDDEDLGEMQSTQPHTTSRDGITEDIIYAGSGCHYDNAEDCSVIGSGTGDEIITGVVFVTTTTTPKPSSTVKPTPPCRGHECENSSRLRLTPGPGTTRSPKDIGPGSGRGRGSGDGNGYNINGQRGAGSGGLNGHQIVDEYEEDSTAEPGKQSDKGGSSINLGLILGVLGSVLLAVIVLAIAFCKLRSRDEGTYKVDETQNFSALHSKKTQGNSAMASGSESGGKRGKKKDVKEWYV